jgi:hypothetical protein
MHLQRELPCQDACRYGVIGSDAVAIAVADGLGSAARSETGAKLAVESAFQFCSDVLSAPRAEETKLEDVVRNASAHAREAIESHAYEENCDLRDLACTLIVVIASRGRFAVAHIGDGAVVAETEERLSISSGPGDSEYTNEVVPITSSAWQDSLRIFASNSGVSAIAVFTDGCQRATFSRSEGAIIPFDRFFAPIFRYARQVTDETEGTKEIAVLLSSPKICEHSDDDKTLVVAVMGVD